jgi:hypothetical protein
MSNWIVVLTTLSFLLTGCSNDSSPKKSMNEKIVQEESEKPQASATEEIKDEEKSAPAQMTFVDYRPKAGITKQFYDQGTLMFTEKIIAVNEQYVQRVLELGNAVTVQVLKWTADEITVVYESFESPDPSKNILDTFTPSEKIQPIVSTAGNKDIEIVDTKASLKVPQGEYDQVLIVKKATHEVADADSYLTYYLAPGVGIIKEVYEVTGEQGYKAGSELQEMK